MATATRTPVAPKNDMFTVLLIISLAAMVIGCMLLLLDFMDYGTATPPDVPKATTIKSTTPAPAPGAGGLPPALGDVPPPGQAAPAPAPTTQPANAPPPAPPPAAKQ